MYLYDVQNKDSTRVTDDGKTNLYYNGIPDWVYEGSRYLTVLMILCWYTEEVLATNYALWWSPDGQQLLYLSLNDTLVTEFMFPIYGLSTNRYTEIDAIAYPKVMKRERPLTGVLNNLHSRLELLTQLWLHG